MRCSPWMNYDERRDLRPECIDCAAIRCAGAIFSVPRPGRHPNVFKKIADETDVRTFSGSTQGFLTNTGRFVTREEACVIAMRAGQIKEKTGPAHILFSEDMW